MAMDNTRPFLDWATKSGVWMDPDFEVSSSQYGGLGIFAMKDREEDAVILRIPHTCTFDMDNLLALSKNIGSEASELTGPVFRAVLSCGDLDTETSILRNYIWGFTIVQSICVKLGKQLQALEKIKPYLQILQTTPVLNVDDLHDAQDQLVQALVLEKRRVRKTYEEICERISGFEFPFELAFQLHQAVKSRVLEIPHAIDDGEDFETNVTLVPVLDFANHQKNNNAVFDVDRSSGDVLLRLVQPVRALQEVCISYSPQQEKNIFLRTYGFMPAGEGSYEWRIPSFDQIWKSATNGTTHTNYTALAKWLQVKPQLLIHFDAADSAFLDPQEFQLPILLLPGLEYYAEWSKELDDMKEDVPDGMDIADFVLQLTFQEDKADIVIAGETAYGATCNGAYVNLPNILEQAGVNSEEDYNILVQQSLKLVKDAVIETIATDDKYMKESDNAALISYFCQKKKMLTQIADKCD